MDRLPASTLAPDDLLRSGAPAGLPAVSEPEYLRRIYWWAYLHPGAIHVFERQWLVNLILWGNYADLRNAALADLAASADGRILQLACVYGDFSRRLAQLVSGGGSLSVLDVAQIQLDNLRRKLGPAEAVSLYRQNAAELSFEDGSFDATVAFFLLHEQPEETRIRTIHEAVRVTRPGGRLVIVDYHRPHRMHPTRHIMPAIFRALEPFAMDLWRTDIQDWLPPHRRYDVTKDTFFGGLYQKLVIIPT